MRGIGIIIGYLLIIFAIFLFFSNFFSLKFTFLKGNYIYTPNYYDFFYKYALKIFSNNYYLINATPLLPYKFYSCFSYSSFNIFGFIIPLINNFNCYYNNSLKPIWFLRVDKEYSIFYGNFSFNDINISLNRNFKCYKIRIFDLCFSDLIIFYLKNQFLLIYSPHLINITFNYNITNFTVGNEKIINFSYANSYNNTLEFKDFVLIIPKSYNYYFNYTNNTNNLLNKVEKIFGVKINITDGMLYSYGYNINITKTNFKNNTLNYGYLKGNCYFYGKGYIFNESFLTYIDNSQINLDGFYYIFGNFSINCNYTLFAINITPWIIEGIYLVNYQNLTKFINFSSYILGFDNNNCYVIPTICNKNCYVYEIYNCYDLNSYLKSLIGVFIFNKSFEISNAAVAQR